MGYTTYFDGQIKIDPPLNEKEIQYINKFSETRRMNRRNGPYFVGGSGDFGQGRDADIIDYNSPDPSQPGLWCQWVSVGAGNYIEWDGGEKFYEATEWMQYLIDHFIGENPLAKLNNPEEFDFLQGHIANGEIYAEGEESSDRWKIVVNDNIVTEHQGTVTIEYD